MGYYTRYNLTVRHVDHPYMGISLEEERKIARRLYETIYGYRDNYAPRNLEDVFEEEMKWYDHDSDMFTLSKEFSDYIFLLEGEGEEHDDMWRLCAHNGALELIQAKITFDRPSDPIFMLM